VGSVKVLEKFLWGSWKVLEKSLIFSVKEWEPCDAVLTHAAETSSSIAPLHVCITDSNARLVVPIKLLDASSYRRQ